MTEGFALKRGRRGRCREVSRRVRIIGAEVDGAPGRVGAAMKYPQPMMDEPSIWDTPETWEQWIGLVKATEMPPDQKQAMIEMAELVLHQKRLASSGLNGGEIDRWAPNKVAHKVA